jgi:hypothetical protein
MACARDPGKLTVGPKLDFLDLLQRFAPTDLCPDCQVIRTPRSRHCAICNVCIERFDHHCPWINNCVGVRNHNPFLVFLASTFTLILFSVAVVLTSNKGISLLSSSLGFFQGFLYDESYFVIEGNPLEPLCFEELCHVKPLWYTVLAVILAVGITFLIPVRYEEI